MINLKAGEDFLIYPAHGSAQLLIESVDNAVHQERDVFLPLSQRRDADVDHVKPIVKIYAKLTLLNHLLQGSVSGRNEAHIHRNAFRTAYSLDFPLLNGAQQFRLDAGGELVDLVQKQRTLVGQLKLSHFSAPAGSRKGPLLIAEKL